MERSQQKAADRQRELDEKDFKELMDRVGKLIESGEELSKLVVNPHRPNRLEPRVRKRRPKTYPLMTKPRRQLKKDLESK